MSLFTIGRVCLKIAGRDAGRTCVVVEELDNSYVLIDGDVRRKRANTKHLEPLADVLELKKGASPEEVKKAFASLGFKTWEHKSKQASERQKKQRKVKEKSVTDSKSSKAAKKAVEKEGKASKPSQ